MKYAIPVSGGIVAMHFGHCEQFALFDVDEMENKVVEKELVLPPEHEPGLLPRWLAEKGVSFVIAGGMGSRAQNIFRENNIEVILGSMEKDPDKAIQSYLDGSLDTGSNICDH